MKDAGIFRRVGVRMWSDAKVMSLSKPQPCGQVLWFHLLAGEQTDIIPGLCRIGEAAFAEQLGWPLEGFREAFAEVSSRGMVRADWKARLVWVPNAIHYNAPQSPNVVRSWADAWDRLPECALKLAAWSALRDFTEGMGEGFARAFAETCAKPSANQEQEQEQDLAAAARASARDAATGSAAEDAGGDAPPLVPASPPPVVVPGTASPGLSAEWAAGGGHSPVPAAGGHGAEAAANHAGGEGTKAGPSPPVRERAPRVPDSAAMDSDLRRPALEVFDATEPGHDSVRAKLETALSCHLVPLQGQRKATFDAKVREVGEDLVVRVCLAQAAERQEPTFAMKSFEGRVLELRAVKPGAGPRSAWDAAVQRAEGDCRLWSILLRRAERSGAPLRELVEKLGGVRAALSGGVLTLTPPTVKVAVWLDLHAREELEREARDAQGERVRIVVNPCEPQAAAGGVA